MTDIIDSYHTIDATGPAGDTAGVVEQTLDLLIPEAGPPTTLYDIGMTAVRSDVVPKVAELHPDWVVLGRDADGRAIMGLPLSRIDPDVAAKGKENIAKARESLPETVEFKKPEVDDERSTENRKPPTKSDLLARAERIRQAGLANGRIRPSRQERFEEF